jgi:predicted Zn-dependent peptidase
MACGSIGLTSRRAYLVNAPVQADRTADSIKALNEQVAAFLGKKGVTREELDRTVANLSQQLPGRFETSQAVLGAMMSNSLYRRPDNYYELLADKYRAQTQSGLDTAARARSIPTASPGWWSVMPRR